MILGCIDNEKTGVLYPKRETQTHETHFANSTKINQRFHHSSVSLTSPFLHTYTTTPHSHVGEEVGVRVAEGDGERGHRLLAGQLQNLPRRAALNQGGLR